MASCPPCPAAAVTAHPLPGVLGVLGSQSMVRLVLRWGWDVPWFLQGGWEGQLPSGQALELWLGACRQSQPGLAAPSPGALHGGRMAGLGQRSPGEEPWCFPKDKQVVSGASRLLELVDLQGHRICGEVLSRSPLAPSTAPGASPVRPLC